MKIRKNVKFKLLSAFLTASLLSTSFYGLFPVMNPEAQAEPIPVPAYEWTFDGNSVDGTTVKNIQDTTNTSGSAILLGGASIQPNSERASNVLNLPGGNAGAGSLKLPEDLYGGVTDGFTVSMWIKADASASHYSRIFESSNGTLGTAWQGHSGSWQDTEITFVVGGTDTAATRYNSAIQIGEPNKAATMRNKLIWDKTFEKAKWQHVLVSVSTTDYEVYLNGVKVATTENTDSGASTNATLREALTRLFDPDFLTSLKYNSIGQCVYTSDSDLKAQIDEVRFYNQALSAGQANEVFSSYKVITSELEAKIAQVRSVSPSLYTRASYEALMDQIPAAQAVVDDPVSAANVQNAIAALDEKLGALVEYTGTQPPDPSGNADRRQLDAELASATGLSGELYTEASYQNLVLCIQDIEAINAEAEQPVIDAALLSLRAAVDALAHKVDRPVQPDYMYTFETAVTDGKIINEVTGTGDAIVNNSAAIVSDPERGNVLSFPGGASGNGGSMTLPSGLFAGVDRDGGFAIAMWAKVDPQSAYWSRLFDAGAGDFSSGGSKDNIFMTAHGVTDLYTPAGNGQMPGDVIEPGKWVHVVFSVNGTEQVLYVNGVPVHADKSNAAIFNNISSFTYSSVGRSRYSEDNDLKAAVDDVMFFKRALNSNEAIALAGEENVPAAASVSVAGKANVLYVEPGQFNLKYDIGNDLSVYAKDQINVVAAVASAQVDVAGTGTNNVFDITVTSANGKNTARYTLTLLNLSDGAVINFDATKSTGPVMHGASGFLYGVSEPNVPTMDLLSPLKPQVLVQKAKDGKQHPTGDSTRLTSMLRQVGVRQIQVYLQDYYLEWPYEFNGIEDYKQKAINIINQMKEANNGDLSDYSFVLFNEPDGIWYNGNVTQFNRDWLTIYTAVKAIDKDIKVVGPNTTGYVKSWMDSFFRFCGQNDCLPEIISWHELYDGADAGNSLVSYKNHYNYTQGLIDTYYRDKGLKEPEIVINEYALFENVGTAGSLVKWLSMFEETKTYACMAYWGLANSLNELAAEANKPNSAWWLYKWYGDMQGNTVQAAASNVKDKGTYGLTAVDEPNKTIKTIFGGQDGTQTVYINNLTALEGFEGAASAHVKLYSTTYSGQQGFEENTPVEFEGNLTLENGSLKLQVKDCNALDAFYAIVTPATDAIISTIEGYNKNWTATYEAENARLLGNATAYAKAGGSDLARSNRADVGSINSSSDGVEFSVNVPKDGKYKLKIYYSSQAPNVDPITLEVKASGQNRAIGKLMQHQLTVDGTNSRLVTYESTVKWGYFNYAAVYLDLTAGNHTLTLKHYGEDQSAKSQGIQLAAILDKIDLIYDSGIGAEKSIPAAVIEPEEVTGTSPYKSGRAVNGFSGGGYATGSGSFPMTVVVSEDGLYDMSVRYHTDISGTVNILKQEVDYPEDAASTSPIGQRQVAAGGFTTSANNAWTVKDCGKVYLTAGANTIILSSNENVDIDRVNFVRNEVRTAANTVAIEAEDCTLEGHAVVIDNSYASKGKMADGIGIGQNPENAAESNRLTLKVNVKKAGDYKLSMVYANNEPAPVMVKSNGDNYVHPYNTDLVERYAQIAVNGAEAETVYFRNTLSWDMLRNVVIDVNLKEGENTIVIYNDNSYHFSSIVNSTAPRFDKFEIIPAYMAPQEGTTPPATSPAGGSGTTAPAVPAAENGTIVPEIKSGTDGKAAAEVNADSFKAAVESSKTGTVVIDARITGNSLTVRIPARPVLEADPEKLDSVVVEAGIARIAIPADVLKSEISGSSTNIELTVEKADAESLPEQVREKVSGYMVYDFTLDVDGEKITGADKKIKLAIPYTLKSGENPNNIVAYYVNDNGEMEIVRNSRFSPETGSLEFETQQFGKFIPVYARVGFNDIENVTWAKEAIEALAAREVLAGTGNGGFSPKAGVTRAEFIQMLMNALDIMDDSAQTDFTDVGEGSWYYKAVASAQKLGIVSGKSDGSYGINDAISRQDMAVMIYKAANYTGVDLKSGEAKKFSDDSQISPYAKNAIEAIQSAGIISGTGGNRFAPKQNATRAEAAVIIYRLFQAIK